LLSIKAMQRPARAGAISLRGWGVRVSFFIIKKLRRYLENACQSEQDAFESNDYA
jgi:hypothetical protein